MQLVEGLTGLAVRGTPWHAPTATPRDVPPGMGMVGCVPMPVLVQWGRAAPGAGWVGGCCRGKGRECGRRALAPGIAPCLSFSSNAAERVLLGCAGRTVRHAGSCGDPVPGADPWHLRAQLRCPPSQLFLGVLGMRAHPGVTSGNG